MPESRGQTPEAHRSRRRTRVLVWTAPHRDAPGQGRFRRQMLLHSGRGLAPPGRSGENVHTFRLARSPRDGLQDFERQADAGRASMDAGRGELDALRQSLDRLTQAADRLQAAVCRLTETLDARAVPAAAPSPHDHDVAPPRQHAGPPRDHAGPSPTGAGGAQAASSSPRSCRRILLNL